MSRYSLLRMVALVALGLAFVVVVLGAYVRLNNAGLGCPDWPGCYGHVTPAGAAAAFSAHGAAQGEPAPDVGKAWREMVHRYAAGTLVTLIVLLCAMSIAWRAQRLLAPPLPLTLLGVVLLQAVLGMLTVTWQLTPLIVTLHLLFGLTTLSLLAWLVMSLPRRSGTAAASLTGPLGPARALALAALLMLGLQIALGGWTSSNYAAIACPDLPTCQGQWWPQADFASAYTLWHRLGINYEGGVLAPAARVAIHFTHRLGALATSVLLLSSLGVAWRVRSARVQGAVVGMGIMLALQLSIGIAMVLRGFPLWLATAHNAGAALLLLATLALNRALRPIAP